MECGISARKQRLYRPYKVAYENAGMGEYSVAPGKRGNGAGDAGRKQPRRGRAGAEFRAARICQSQQFARNEWHQLLLILIDLCQAHENPERQFARASTLISCPGNMKGYQLIATLLLAGCIWRGAGQTGTGIDFNTQARLRAGTTLPSQCTAGQLFFKTDAPAGANLYTCPIANVWAPVGLATGVAANRPASCSSGQIWLSTDTGVMTYCSAAGTWNVGPTVGTDGQITYNNGGIAAGSNLSQNQDGSVSATKGFNPPLCTVALSASPVFDAAQCNTFSLTLGSTAVTGTTLVNAKAGQTLTFLINQDQSGGRTFAWPQNVAGACAISATAGVSTTLSAFFDGTKANTTQCTTSDAATLITGPTRGAPPTPPSGLSCWFDTGGATWKCKDTGGAVHAAVLTAAGPAGNQYLTYIDADGVPHAAQISAGQLAEGTTGSGTVVLSGSPTIVTPTIASFVNAQHSHANAASGGQITEAALALTDVATADVSSVRHGLMPKLSGLITDVFRGDGTWGAGGSGGASPGVGRATLFATWTTIADLGCQEQSASWPGITTADIVILGEPGTLGSGVSAFARVTAPDTVTITICNTSGGPVTPGPTSFRATLAVYNLSSSGTLDFAPIWDGNCGSQTFPSPGIVAGDPLAPKWPATLEAGLTGTMRALTDSVEVRLCNYSGATIDPAPQSFGVSVAK